MIVCLLNVLLSTISLNINHGLVYLCANSVTRNVYFIKKYVSNPTEYRHFKYKQFRNKVSNELKKQRLIILEIKLHWLLVI